MTVHKDTAELYRIRSKSGEWATIALTDFETEGESGKRYGGEIMIQSTFGNFAYYWSHCGVPFKQSLQKMDFGYFMNKAYGPNYRVFDGSGTFRSILERVIDLRREGRLTKQEARDLFLGFKESQEEAEASLHDFVRVVQEVVELLPASKMRYFSEPWEYEVKEHDPRLQGFWKEIWPEFIAQLASESPIPVVRKGMKP